MINFFWRSKEFIKTKLNKLIDKKMHQQQRQWMQGSNILFTQIKSGTTFFTNFFAATNYLRFNFKDEFDLTQPEKYGAFRITRSNYKNIEKKIKNFNENFSSSMPFLFVSHHRQLIPKILDSKTKVIMTTREKIDWIDSALDFKFVKREKKLSRKMAIDLLLKRYKNTDLDQKNLQIDHKQSIILNYENLFNNKEIIDAFQFLGINLNQDTVEKIKNMISKEKIKEAEEKLGYAIVAGKDFKPKSFINEKEVNKSNFTLDEIQYIKDHK